MKSKDIDIALHNDTDLFVECLKFTSGEKGFRTALIEKDYFCSLLLAYVFSEDTALVLKGGTSLNIIRIELFDTFRADSMSELRLRMIAYIRFDLIPVAFIVPYFFAGGTDGQHSAQCFDLCQ